MKERSLFKKSFFYGVFLLSALFFVFFLPSTTNAGFGVTPPYVKNTELTRNSIYEQRILLVRGSPDFDVLAEVVVDVPGADEWITIEPAGEILMPAGEQRIPLIVKVLVPDKADFGDYKGNIRVSTRAVRDEDRGSGAVSIALGARINVDLAVIDRIIREFDIRSRKILDFNEGRKVWWLEYPGKMTLSMMLRNTGNISVSPDKVTVDIYNSANDRLLERMTHTNKIKKVPPFKTEEVFAELPSHLPPGSYVGRYAIYNGEKTVDSGELSFNIMPAGTIAGDTGYGFMGLSLWHKTTIVGPIVLLILLVFSIVLYFSKRTRRGLVRGIYAWRNIYRFPIDRIRRFFSLIMRGFGRRTLSRD